MTEQDEQLATMKAQVRSDQSTRIIEIDIWDGPELHDETATWRAKPKIFRAEVARILINAGTLRSITVSGHQVLKDGRFSDVQRESASWYPDDNYRNNLDKAPQWVRDLASEAPAGVTGWIWGLDTATPE